MKWVPIGLVLYVCASSALCAGEDLNIRAYGILPNGERRSNIKIVREEVERTTLLPLLPYVFFERGSAEIPARYVRFGVREGRIFSEREFVTVDAEGRRSSITAYYNILNIIGKRLRDEPMERITLVGSTDGTEGDPVASSRAQAVRDYLHTTFEIDTGRMAIMTRALPSSTTTTKDAEISAQENRRVTIEGPWSITQPVVVRDTTTTVSPPSVEFQIASDIQDVTSFMIRAWQRDYDDPLYLYEHVSVPKQARVWHLDRDPSRQPRTEDPLEYEGIVQDAQHRAFESEVRKIPVEQATLLKKKRGQVRGATVLHQYNLILFDFASAALRTDHARIIDSMIAQDGAILPYSTVVVRGYTDSTGTADLNQRLSQERAEAAAARVRERYSETLTPDAVSSEGIGMADVLQMPNGLSTPESRMYARTVHIIISNRRDR